jgi:hypothetical protein
LVINVSGGSRRKVRPGYGPSVPCKDSLAGFGMFLCR